MRTLEVVLKGLREEFEKAQDAQMSDVSKKVAKLESDMSQVALQLLRRYIRVYLLSLLVIGGYWVMA